MGYIVFKRIIQSNFDIDEDVLENIKHEEILREEHKHINSLLEQNGIFSSKFLIFTIGLVVTGLSTMLWQMHSFFIIQLPTIKNLGELSSQLESFTSDIMKFSIAVGALFLIVGGSGFFYGIGLKKRKKTIINLLDKIHIKSSKYKGKNKII